MNIFYLDQNIKRCAQAHCDKHVVKMILESAQILCTVLHEKGLSAPYKRTHQHHPCVLWAGASLGNWRWLFQLTKALDEEYRYRFEQDSSHRSWLAVKDLKAPHFSKKRRTPHAQIMPEQYQQGSDPIAAYRAFYQAEKAHLLTYTRREPPNWLNLA